MIDLGRSSEAESFLNERRERFINNAGVKQVLGNIAMKTGKKLHWDAQKEQFIGAPDASALLTRELRKPWAI
jgi:hypothetical protein